MVLASINQFQQQENRFTSFYSSQYTDTCFTNLYSIQTTSVLSQFNDLFTEKMSMAFNDQAKKSATFSKAPSCITFSLQ